METQPLDLCVPLDMALAHRLAHVSLVLCMLSCWSPFYQEETEGWRDGCLGNSSAGNFCSERSGMATKCEVPQSGLCLSTPSQVPLSILPVAEPWGGHSCEAAQNYFM